MCIQFCVYIMCMYVCIIMCVHVRVCVCVHVLCVFEVCLVQALVIYTHNHLSGNPLNFDRCA